MLNPSAKTIDLFFFVNGVVEKGKYLAGCLFPFYHQISIIVLLNFS